MSDERLSDVRSIQSSTISNSFRYFSDSSLSIDAHARDISCKISFLSSRERYAKLCLMNAYLMSARYKEGENAGFEAYHLLPATASLEERKDILQEISLACASTDSEESLKYLKEFEIVLDKMSRQEAKFKLRIHHTSYLLLETLYANYYLQNGHIDEARIHLKKMNEYFSPTDYIPCRGLYTM